MTCNPDVLKQVPLFALLDEEEIAVLAAQVDIKTFARRQRIYKTGDPGGRAYVLISGSVRVTTVDEDHQEVVIDGNRVGHVTSGSPAPFLKKNIGLAYVPVEYANVGQAIQIDVRGRLVGAQITKTPFYKRNK